MAATEENVEHLVRSMLTHMEEQCVAIEASADDVVSAAMTLALRTIRATRSMHCDMEPLKQVASLLVLECMPAKTELLQ